VSMVIGRKTLFLLHLNDPENPIELAFQNKFGDGYILLGFSNGFFVVISTHVKEIGQELFQIKNHKESLADIAISKPLGKAASCGDNVHYKSNFKEVSGLSSANDMVLVHDRVKVHELSEMKEISEVLTVEDERHLDAIEWSADGQLLAMSSPRGNIYVYLSKLPLLGASHGLRIAYLTSLLEVSIAREWDDVEDPCGANIPGLGALPPGHWNEQSCMDKTLTISNAEGDTIRQAVLRAEPSDIQFSEMKQDERAAGENTVSMVIGRKTLFLLHLNDPENPIELAFQNKYGHIVAYVSMVIGRKTLFLLHLNDPENPIELAFQNKYGHIVAYEWFGDGYILLGFSNGYFVVISTHVKEIGQELFQIKNHKESLADIAISKSLGKAASCGDNVHYKSNFKKVSWLSSANDMVLVHDRVKVHELSEMKEISEVLTVEDERHLDAIEWSADGQLLAMSSPRGNIYVYLSKLPLLGASHGLRIAYLTSLLEVSIASFQDKESGMMLRIPVEPTFLALGPYHLAIGMNNRAWFFSLGEEGTNSSVPPELVRDREYLGTVQDLLISDTYASVLYEGRLQLHLIEGEAGEAEERESKLFPDREHSSMIITTHAITPEFLIYASDSGGIYFFHLEDWTMASEFRHTTGVRDLFLQLGGLHLFLLDDRVSGHIYNPVLDETVPVPDLPSKVRGVLWDTWPGEYAHVFVVYDTDFAYSYVFLKDSVAGGGVVQLGKTFLSPGSRPLLLCNGELTCQTAGGKLATVTLASHDNGSSATTEVLSAMKRDELEALLKRSLALHRLKQAWRICEALKSAEAWDQLGKTALNDLDIETSIKVYRHLGNVGMVWSLKKLVGMEDKMLLAGHAAMILGDFTRAQELYLRSNEPRAALDMRRDLLQWDQALQLARKLSPDQIPFISREYAQQLEFMGDYANALSHYEKGLLDGRLEDDEQNMACRAGIARMSLRCGDLRKGLVLAGQLNSKSLKRECAEILETMKASLGQFSEAASLYEKANLHEKAAALYIKMKNWPKVGELLANITSPKIHLQYAKAKEAEGRYREAVAAYEMAHDYDSVVRIYLDHLNNPDAAVTIVRNTKSVEGAKKVARFFQKLNDYSSAIQFLVMSQCNEEAFRLAQKYGKMDMYAEIIGSEASPEDYKSIGLHFENERNPFLAGRFFHLAGQHERALKHLMRAAQSGAEEAAALRLAVEVAASSSDESLSNRLVDFLLGDVDQVPKDPRYLFRLYMAKGQLREAAKTAIIIAREEQNNGNYRNAHDVLFGMCQELRKQKLRMSADMAASLELLHSYILVKLHVRRGEHRMAARMLVRVADNISRFPAHKVPILTSTVIECHRSGLKESAFNFAAMLLRPEYRDDIDPKYRKKIEAIVRRPPRDGVGQEEEPKTPCPACSYPIAETGLDCSQCKNHLPFCIVTGRHLVRGDLTSCPRCNFPAIRSEFVKLVGSGDGCPMCSSGDLKPDDLPQLSDPTPFLQLDTST
ncbi:unnamed protein product, partial [Darwinula stevensoni]